MGKTEENLKASFTGESMARNKYDFFAKTARNEGYEQIANIFAETALNEKSHAKIALRLMRGIGTTKENLKQAIEGETYEFKKMYPEFARIAKEEGSIEALKFFDEVLKVEEEHEKRFAALLENLEKGEVFKKSSKTRWRCMECGLIVEGTEAPEICPLCKHPRAFFEVVAKNY